ncbi:universal stress protein [Mucilaginibacter sp. AW1-3]
MKTILVPTDFSEASENAARYAIKLAKSIKAHVKLCNAFKVPGETPIAAQVVWPLENYDDMKKDVMDELAIVAKRLEAENISEPEQFQPHIDYTCEAGNAVDVIRNIVDDQNINMIVMGMSGAGFINRLFLGSTSRTIIDKIGCPVLLVPLKTSFKPINKIGFATDLDTDDINVIHSLAGLARHINAELLIAHITDDEFLSEGHQHKIDEFLTEVTCKANYNKIYYRNVNSNDVEQGLDSLVENGQIDMLVMVHHRHHFFNRILTGSYTKKMLGHIPMPLLVYLNNEELSALPVF